MKQNLKEIHLRISESELSRIDKLKEEFRLKSRLKLCRILLSGSADDLEEHIHFADANATKEIREMIVDLANDIRHVKWNLSKIGSNINQIAKATNVAKKSDAVASNLGAVTYEIQLHKYHLERGEAYVKIIKEKAEDFIRKYKESYLKNDTRMMNVNADFIHTYCENADEIIAIIHQNAQAVSQSEVVQSSAQVTVNFDADEIRNLIAEMEEASEKLGEILWNIK